METKSQSQEEGEEGWGQSPRSTSIQGTLQETEAREAWRRPGSQARPFLKVGSHGGAGGCPSILLSGRCNEKGYK